MTARLLLPHKTPGVPVRLQRTGGTDALFALRKKPVEKGIQHIYRDAFEGGRRVLLGELAVSSGIDELLISLLAKQRRDPYWHQNLLTRLNMFSLPVS